jgi:hypothetical protein
MFFTRKLIIPISIFCLLFGQGIQASNTGEQEFSFWIKVVDQNGSAIKGADVYYCIFDCILDRNAHNRKLTSTNAEGKAQIFLKPRGTVRLQGVSKAGYDIRLSTYPYATIRLNQAGNQELDWQNPYGGISFQFEPGATPFNSSEVTPVATVKGWKLGTMACIEQDHAFIGHDGRAESKWRIEDQRHYYLLGDEQHSLRKGDRANHDFSITINRKFYPWGNLLYGFISYYEAELSFSSGGAQTMKESDYPHQLPRDGYSKNFMISFRGIGEVSTTHIRKLYIKSHGRYGVMQLALTPSRNVFFEYLINRSPDSPALNIPPMVFEFGVPNNYFSCYASASTIKPYISPPGRCADLPSQQRSC